MINNTTSSNVAADAAAIASTVFARSSQRKVIPHVWHSPFPDEFWKRVIHGKPHTWNNNGSWNIDAIPDLGLILEDAAAATAIATVIASTKFTRPTTIDIIFITVQKTAGAALTAASAATKTIKLPTII